MGNGFGFLTPFWFNLNQLSFPWLLAFWPSSLFLKSLILIWTSRLQEQNEASSEAVALSILYSPVWEPLLLVCTLLAHLWPKRCHTDAVVAWEWGPGKAQLQSHREWSFGYWAALRERISWIRCGRMEEFSREDPCFSLWMFSIKAYRGLPTILAQVYRPIPSWSSKAKAVSLHSHLIPLLEKKLAVDFS